MTALSEARPTCGACNAFDPDEDATDGERWGFCREGPGVPVLDDEGSPVTLLPVKTEHEWCRRFQPRQ